VVIGGKLFFRKYQEFIAEHTTEFLGMLVWRAQKRFNSGLYCIGQGKPVFSWMGQKA
jgi:hypothetical protein